MEAMSFQSRDWMTIHGYITYPPGVERRNLPVVLNVHGGPWARDSWGYNPEGQWLSNRGYVCLQVNFRGSTGYGKGFLNAGDKEWGGNMQNDLVDGETDVDITGLTFADLFAAPVDSVIVDVTSTAGSAHLPATGTASWSAIWPTPAVTVNVTAKIVAVAYAGTETRADSVSVTIKP